MSETRTRTTPNAADAGMRYLLSEPMNSLTTCGQTRPTNPMIPVKLTMLAATKDTIIKQNMRSLSASTPMDLALSSPVDRRLILSEITWSITTPMTVTAAMTGMYPHWDFPRVPTCHVYTAARSSGSARSMNTVVNALNMYITAIPARIIVDGEA